MKNFKVKLVLLLLICFSLAIILRLFYLQIKKGEYFEALALGQQVSFEQVTGERGQVFFNDGKTLLAQTKNKYIIYIFPDKVSDIEGISNILKQDIKGTQVIRKEVSKQVFELVRGFDGVQTEQAWGRNYPQNELGAHVIGFINQEGQGQYGIEGFYDEVLKGEQGFKKTSFWSSPLKSIDFKGTDIVLTLDYNIQYFAEKSLKQAKETWDIDSGQVIVTEPSTGKILAMAVYPEFNPNYYSKEKDLDIFVNPCLQKLFEPGSVFKPMGFAAALEQGVITPETTYVDKGFVNVGGPPIYNFQKREWGEQSMTDVLEESINTGAVFVQQELGRDLFLKYLEKFGFFKATDIDLQGETYSLNQVLRTGYPRDIATASFGQGIELTPIHIVKAFGAIANKGRLMRPYIVDRVIESNGKIITNEPKQEERVISETTAKELINMLISVVENGSARRAKIEGYDIAGKTGTAQVPLKSGGYSEYETIQSFVGFFPALEPRFLIFIKLDNPKEVGMAGYSVVPFFRDLAKYIIDSEQIAPSY